MRYNRLAVVLSVLLMVGLGPAICHAASSLKIGYFDMGEIMNQSKWGNIAKDTATGRATKLRDEVKTKTDDLKAMQDEYKKKELMMDDNAKATKVREIRQLQMERERLLIQSNQELNNLRKQLQSPIVAKVIEIVGDIGKKDDYDYILEKTVIPFANEKLDLTDRIVKALDKATPADPYKDLPKE